MKLSYTDQINGFFSLTDVQEWMAINTSKPTNTYKIIFNLGSPIHFEVNLESYILKKNQIAFITPGSYVSFLKNNNEENYIIDFNSEFYCLDLHDKEISCNGLLFGAHKQIPLLHTTLEEKKTINPILHDIKNELEGNDTSQGDMLRLLLKKLIIISVRIGKKQLFNTQNPAVDETDIVRKFYSLVEIHFREKHKVSDYADMMFKSPKTLSNTLTKLKGISPLSIIQNRIILEAKRQLYYTDKNIKEICYDLGFSEPAQFSRLFKNVTGKTPSDFQVQILV